LGGGLRTLHEGDADGLAGPADLPALAEVAYAAGHLDVTIEAWERAYAVCVEAGDTDAAAVEDAVSVRGATGILVARIVPSGDVERHPGEGYTR